MTHISKGHFTSSLRNGLAVVFEAQQKLDEAEPLFRRALEGNVVHYGTWAAENPRAESQGGHGWGMLKKRKKNNDFGRMMERMRVFFDEKIDLADVRVSENGVYFYGHFEGENPR